tara:strand:- start:124 stop:999 length:876 start_codon:yes stop_codon:yes gene_type:complete
LNTERLKNLNYRNKKARALVLAVLAFSFIGCTNSQTDQESINEQADSVLQEVKLAKAESAATKVIEKNGLRLLALAEESPFPNASLKMISPKGKVNSGKQTFQFEVEDFDLAEPTEGDRSSLLANSAKGQHIHFILNNGPYQAQYENEFEAELSQGHNVILAFLSRSYHESVKSEEAFVFTDIQIGEDYAPFDHTAPHLIYSRPKGSYKLSESNRILIDFYLLNAELSAKGMKVELSIDETIFLLDSWQPYWVEGLDAGEHQFRLRLIDDKGNLVFGPFNDSGVRVVKIEE